MDLHEFPCSVSKINSSDITSGLPMAITTIFFPVYESTNHSPPKHTQKLENAFHDSISKENPLIQTPAICR